MSFPTLFPIDPGAVPTTQEVPGQLEGLSLWYRSDNVVLTNGNEVLQWPDLSGNGYHLSAPTVGQRPEYYTNGTLLNGLPYISGSGATDLLLASNYTELNGGSGTTTFIVSHMTNPHPFPGSQQILGLPTDVVAPTGLKSNLSFFYQGSLTAPISILFHANLPSPPSNFSSNLISLADATLTVPCIYTVNINRLLSGFLGVEAFNGGTPLVLSNLPASNTFVGGNLGFNSFIIVMAQRSDGTGHNPARNYEIIQYNRILSTIERNQVHQYLSTRYNIPVV